MVKDVIGYRFSPTGEEVINHYLKNKILGKTWLTDEAISEINILSYLPKFLPRYAKIRSDDLYWYFFYRIEYLKTNTKAMKRSTTSGFWKPTGKDRQIRDKRGNSDEIGLKKSLVYYEGKGPNAVRTLWSMNEYHITSLPQNQRTFVVCQVKYKGDHKDISYGNNSSETGQAEFHVEQLDQQDYGLSMKDLSIPLNEQEDLSEWDEYVDPNTMFFNVLQQSPYLTQEDNQFLSEVAPAYREIAQALLSDQEMQERTDFVGAINTLYEFEQPSQENVHDLSVRAQIPERDDPFLLYSFEPISLLSDYNHSSVSSELIPQENHNKHRPKKPLTGYIDCNSDSDTDDAENHNRHRPKIRFIYYSSDSGIDESESISAMSHKGSSSSVNSVDSSSTDFRKDLQTSADSSTRNTREDQLTRPTEPSEPEVKHETSTTVKASMEEKSSEKKGLGFITEEEAIERNRKIPQYVYLMNTIVAFILLMVLIRNIISVILTVKA